MSDSLSAVPRLGRFAQTAPERQTAFATTHDVIHSIASAYPSTNDSKLLDFLSLLEINE